MEGPLITYMLVYTDMLIYRNSPRFKSGQGCETTLSSNDGFPLSEITTSHYAALWCGAVRYYSRCKSKSKRSPNDVSNRSINNNPHHTTQSLQPIAYPFHSCPPQADSDSSCIASTLFLLPRLQRHINHRPLCCMTDSCRLADQPRHPRGYLNPSCSNPGSRIVLRRRDLLRSLRTSVRSHGPSSHGFVCRP